MQEIQRGHVVRAGLAKRLRFQTAPAHMELLMSVIRRSPALASATLAFRDLAPHNTTADGARLRHTVATACLESASRAAEPLHTALAQACPAGARSEAALHLSQAHVTAFLSTVMPPNISKVRKPNASPQHS